VDTYRAEYVHVVSDHVGVVFSFLDAAGRAGNGAAVSWKMGQTPVSLDGGPLNDVSTGTE